MHVVQRVDSGVPFTSLGCGSWYSHLETWDSGHPVFWVCILGVKDLSGQEQAALETRFGATVLGLERGQGFCMASGAVKAKTLCSSLVLSGFLGSQMFREEWWQPLISRPCGWFGSAGLVESPLYSHHTPSLAQSARSRREVSLPTGKGVHFAVASCRCSLLGWHFTTEI